MADVVISDLPELIGLTADDYVIVNDGDATTTKVSFANVLASITNVGIVGFADGTESNPAVTFTSDVNIGIYRPNPDEWAVSTNGTQRFVINAAGNIGINNYSPGAWNDGSNNLVVGSPAGGDNGIVIASSSASVGDLTFSDGVAGTDLYIGRLRYDHNDNHMSMWTNATEAMRIDQNQDILIGTAVPILGSRVVIDGGATSIPTGSPGIPSLNFATDTDTGVWSAAPDHVSIATGGIERGTIDDEGHIYLNGDSDTYIYHSGPNQLTLVNQDVETLTVDANNNVRLGGATPTIYTNNSEIRLSVDADADNPGSLVSIYASGAELGRFTTSGFALGTTSHQGIATVGGSVVAGYPSMTFVRADDSTTTTTLAFAVPGSVIRGAGTINNVTNDSGTFVWSIGGTNVAAGTAGATEYMSLDTTALTLNADLSTNSNIHLTGASATGTFFSTPVADSVAISTGGSERFRVADNGAIGLGGANYGTAGQVLQSNGPSAQPTWVSLATDIPDISTLPEIP